MKYRHILVPIDFSPQALSAYQTALDYFADPACSLVLLHVLEPEGEHFGGRPLEPGEVEQRRRQLQTLANSHRGRWRDVSTLTESGKPTAIIIETARREKVDLVLMGSHGAGGLAKTLFGSTTYDVARKVSCAVMICKTD